MRNCSSHSSIKTLLCFDHFYVVFDLNRPPGKLFRKHSGMLGDFLQFSTNLPFLLQRKVEGRYIGFLYATLQELGGICLLVFENTANKVS